VSAALDAQRRDGRLAITYEIVYGHAWKVASSRTAEGHAIVRATFPTFPRRTAR
jgi:malonyl-CoA O-methyltransferase